MLWVAHPRLTYGKLGLLDALTASSPGFEFICHHMVVPLCSGCQHDMNSHVPVAMVCY